MLNKNKKQLLADAIEDLEKKPESFFGEKRILMEELPCIKQKKMKMVKCTNNFDERIIREIERLARQYSVSKSSLLNDILKTALSIE